MATQIVGIEEVDRFLAGIPKRYTKKFIQQAFRKAARPLVKRAKQLAPRKTGILRKSVGAVNAKKNSRQLPGVLVMPIQSKRFQAGTTKTGKATLRSVSKKKLKEGIVTKKDTSRAWYAHFLTGTASRQTKSTKAHRGRISGFNFMVNAFNATEAQVRDESQKAMIAIIQKEAKRKGFTS